MVLAIWSTRLGDICSLQRLLRRVRTLCIESLVVQSLTTPLLILLTWARFPSISLGLKSLLWLCGIVSGILLLELPICPAMALPWWPVRLGGGLVLVLQFRRVASLVLSTCLTSWIPSLPTSLVLWGLSLPW